jgi:hypothetical protein
MLTASGKFQQAQKVLFDNMRLNDLKNMITEPTRTCNTRQSLLDPVLVSDNCNVLDSWISSSSSLWIWVSEWLLFNTNSAIFQLCHGENKLILQWDDDDEIHESRTLQLSDTKTGSSKDWRVLHVLVGSVIMFFRFTKCSFVLYIANLMRTIHSGISFNSPWKTPRITRQTLW